MKDTNNVLPFESKEKMHWVEHYAQCAINRIDDTTPCRKSWQDDMVKIMEKKIIEKYLKNTSMEQIEKDRMTLQLENTNV